MRALVRLAVLSLVVMALPWGGSQAARADEAPQDESAASKAFRDAWWAETGGGNLTQALDLYAKAADAQGPAAVRARALYRRAVVLQRIGKTEDAIRALERLAKDFPGETDLQTQARARLTEWTAVDLRTSFGDWFRRYQYSPEFQAKVVDLVLKLGSGDDVTYRTAEAELLTIGAAAIPALKEHLAPRNDALQYRADKVLLLLGELPDRLVVPHSWWRNLPEAWVTILNAPRERAAVLAARVQPTSASQHAVRAALDGPEAALTWLASPPDPRDPGPRRALFDALRPTLATTAATASRFAAIVVDRHQPEDVRSQAAWWIQSSGFATPELVRAWALSDAREVRQVAWTLIRSRKVLTPAQAWPVLSEVFSSPTAGGLRSSDADLVGAFYTALEEAPWPTDLEVAANAVARAGGILKGTPAVDQDVARERYRQTLERVFEDAKDGNVSGNALQAWLQLTPVDRSSAERLGKWAREAPLRGTRERAALELVAQMRQENLDIVLELMLDPALPPEEARKLWYRVLQDSQWGAILLAGTDRTRRLLARVDKLPEQNSVRSAFLDALMSPITRQAIGPESIVEAWLADPGVLPHEFLQDGHYLRQAVQATGLQSRWRAAWFARWPAWTPEQRHRALQGLRYLLGGPGDPQSVAFVREKLHARPPDVPKGSGALILQFLGDVTVEDVRAAYDLSKLEDVDAAASLLTHNTTWFKLSPELFRILAPALRPDGNEIIANQMVEKFQAFPEVAGELAAALLEHKVRSLRHRGMQVLLERSSPEDEALWLKALKDPNPSVRVLAAKGMLRVPTAAVKRALVLALDDPHPDVRALALASLEAIKKLEVLKEAWREEFK